MCKPMRRRLTTLTRFSAGCVRNHHFDQRVAVLLVIDSVVLRPGVICASLQHLFTADVGQVGVAVCLKNVFVFSNVRQDGCFALKFHQNTRVGEPEGP